MLKFNPDLCVIPSIYCGDGDIPAKSKTDNVVYTRKGTGYECMKKGIGVGIHQERKKTIPGGSLQTIKYVGDVYEKKFNERGISTIKDLLNIDEEQGINVERLLKDVLRKKDGKVDGRAYNSVLLFMHKSGVSDRWLPPCMNLRQ